jgi:hypothetical protein
MHLFTIKTTKKSRVFSIDTGGFFGLGVYFHQKRSKIDGDKEPRRVIQRSYALMMPFFALETEVYIHNI